MAQVWQCDRCGEVSRNGTIDDPPDEWVIRSMPVRGSEGARSSMAETLCDVCDDALYRWRHREGEWRTDTDTEHLQACYEAQRRNHNRIAAAAAAVLSEVPATCAVGDGPVISWAALDGLRAANS